MKVWCPVTHEPDDRKTEKALSEVSQMKNPKVKLQPSH